MNRSWVTFGVSTLLGATGTLIAALSGCLDSSLPHAKEVAENLSDAVNGAYHSLVTQTIVSSSDNNSSDNDIKRDNERDNDIGSAVALTDSDAAYLLGDSASLDLNYGLPAKSGYIYDTDSNSRFETLSDAIAVAASQLAKNEINKSDANEREINESEVKELVSGVLPNNISDLLNPQLPAIPLIDVKSINDSVDPNRVKGAMVRSVIYNMFLRLPKDMVPKDFVAAYFEEFADDYVKKIGTECSLNVVLVTDKSEFKTYYFDLTSENNKKAEVLIPDAVYTVGTGKQKGTKRTIAGYNPKDRVTPEGLFWVDMITDKPTEVYSNGAYLGPRVISTEAPGQRSPNDDIAFHGTLDNVQWSIGTPRSFGCLRMYNNEVIDLYERLNRTPCNGKGAIVVIMP